MEPLSRRQKDVLTIIEQHLATHGFPPSIREIANRLGLSGTVAAVQHLNALERKGYIRRSKASSRGITLTTPDGANSWQQELLPGVDWENNFFHLPIIEQTYPELLEPDDEDILDKISLDRFGKTTGARFALKICGDAMRGAGILEGDLVLVRPHQGDTAHADIVVVWLQGETLVRRCLHEQGFIRLQPENSSFDPIFVRQSTPGFYIIGTVTGVFRGLTAP